MIRFVWGVLCRNYIESKKTHNVSMIENLERLSLGIRPEFTDTGFPFSFDFALVTNWFNEDEKNTHSAEFKVSMMHPDGKSVSVTKQTIELPPLTFKKFFINFDKLFVEGQGFYKVVIQMKGEDNKVWKRVATLPFRLGVCRTLVY